MTFGINAFAARHTPESEFSHFEGTSEELLALVAAAFPKDKRDGVVIVPVRPDRFCSGVVHLKEGDVLASTFAPRCVGEKAYTQTTVKRHKTPAHQVSIVVYHHTVPGLGPTTGQEWEVVSINAQTDAEPQPIHPVAMMRNQLGLPGGSPALYTSDEFARATLYWTTHANVEARVTERVTGSAVVEGAPLKYLIEMAQTILDNERHWSIMDHADRAESATELARAVLQAVGVVEDKCQAVCEDCVAHAENIEDGVVDDAGERA